MYFSAQRKKKCIDIIDTLLNYKIAKIFAEPVDPILDNCPNYFEKIKRPMDLGTVRKNLVNDNYHLFSEFCADVDLIWENAYEFNGEYSIITILAQQLKIWFHNLTFLMTDDETSDWITKLHDLQNQVCLYTIQFSNVSTKSNNEPTRIEKYQEMDDFSNEFQEDEQNPTHNEYISMTKQIPVLNETKSLRNEIQSKPNEIQSKPNESKPIRNELKPIRNELKPIPNDFEPINELQNMPNDEPQFAHKTNSKSTFSSIEKPKRTSKKPDRIISADDLIEMHQQICLLEDEKALLKILNIIKNHEPQLKVTDKSVIDLNSLSMKTRVKIYDYLQNND